MPDEEFEKFEEKNYALSKSDAFQKEAQHFLRKVNDNRKY